MSPGQQIEHDTGGVVYMDLDSDTSIGEDQSNPDHKLDESTADDHDYNNDALKRHRGELAGKLEN